MSLTTQEEDAMFAAILSSMDVETSDPLVARALGEYARRYAAELLISLKDYSKHADISDISGVSNKSGQRVSDKDLQIAINLHDQRVNKKDIRRRIINETQDSLNTKPLPSIPDHTYLHRLPARPDLISRTYTYVPGFEAYPKVRKPVDDNDICSLF